MTPTPRAAAFGRRVVRGGLGLWPIAAGAIAAAVAAPIALVCLSLARPSVDIWRHLWATQLPELLANTLALIVGLGLGVGVLGTGLAWLVTAYRFPGRGALEWLLILPLAMPAYVMAFVLLALFDYTGPVQRALRALTGGPVRWFPDVASYGGVVAVMTLVLYPYVYMLARAAFFEQSAATLDAARALGVSRRVVFWRVALPLARPSIAAGVSLALMEALADFGTVAIFNYATFTVAIYRVWFGLQNRHAATELASLLVLFTLAIYAGEQRLRGRARFHQRGADRPTSPIRLRGWRAALASGLAGSVVTVAFVVPVARLVTWLPGHAVLDARYPRFLADTVSLAAVTALVTVGAALVVAYGVRLGRSRVVTALARLAGMGYALPGSVIAVGVLGLLSEVDDMLGSVFPHLVGLVATGSLAGLVFAYAVRFLAVGGQTVEASLVKITPTLDMTARSLGVTPWGLLRRVHIPLLRRGLLTAALLVFVDVMKEMPATLLLRPLGYETLAVRVWQFTSESLWEAAALPALTIVAAGVVPVVVLVRRSARPIGSPGPAPPSDRALRG